MTEPWTRTLAVDGYHDWISADGQWKAAEGHNEEARRDGKPWTLFRRSERGAWRRVQECKTLAEARGVVLASDLGREEEPSP